MKKVLSSIAPENVMYYFEQLSSVPRGSGKTDAATRFIIDFAQSNTLKYYSDKLGNVIVYKEASPGRENEKPVIIQGHLDMVWEKENDLDFDFETQGLNLEINGDYISARGTTLGGDDGIAVAMAMALLSDSSISHPPLEVVFTIDEETGMYGAAGIDASVISGRRMLNLDSEEEGTLLVSCAGGARVDINLECKRCVSSLPSFEIKLSGLHGGHSGTEIDKGYANANKVMGEILEYIRKNNTFNIVSISGGTMDNAITRDCSCIISCDSVTEISTDILSLSESLAIKYVNDSEMKITVNSCNEKRPAFDKESTSAIITLLNYLPYGVISMSKDVDNLVETSLNPGVLKTVRDTVSITFAVRSCVDSEKYRLIDKIKTIASQSGACTKVYGEYPAWEFVENSPLQQVMTQVYSEMYNTKPRIAAIHAGLECGLFCGKLEGLDCVSLGPDILDIHTPQEKLSISSTRRVWNYLIKVLERI